MAHILFLLIYTVYSVINPVSLYPCICFWVFSSVSSVYLSMPTLLPVYFHYDSFILISVKTNPSLLFFLKDNFGPGVSHTAFKISLSVPMKYTFYDRIGSMSSTFQVAWLVPVENGAVFRAHC